MGSSKTNSSENILSEKVDVCIANAVVKTGIGFGAGVVLSAILFKKRSFPVWIGIGSGLGSSYSDCQRTFNPINIPGYKIIDSSNSSSSPISSSLTTSSSSSFSSEENKFNQDSAPQRLA